MDRRPTTQDVTWLLDLNRNGQLDLTPPYQRRSVWTRSDRQFFLDTIFRNYPSPALFFHKNIDDAGRVKYFVVDGKQRLETIFNFSANKLRLAQNYGDNRLDGKRWKDIDDADLKRRFWNYQVPVEMIDAQDGNLVPEIFDRLNRNSRRLTPQELRHAKFDGWLITLAEVEASSDVWAGLGISTRARGKRMVDVQFISELIFVVTENRPLGFDQDELSELYAKYDDLEDVEEFSQEDFSARYERAKALLVAMQAVGGAVTASASTFGNFYTLWCVIALDEPHAPAAELAQKYTAFMALVEEIGGLPAGTPPPIGPAYVLAEQYLQNSRGASTEAAQRLARYQALRAAMITE